MYEHIVKHIKQLRIELEQVKLRLNALESRFNILKSPIYDSKTENTAKRLYNRLWSELTPDEKIKVLDETQKKEEEEKL